ncbi:MAG: hypothetical protein M3253_05165, partial [Chloroflexota bacterium]|nr:hypothetical protein [Chloroflexota bacterium]
HTYRNYHLLALCQGMVMVLAGFEVIIPFALDIGCPPALAALLGALPVAGGLAQLFVPQLLARSDGNLRGLTVLAAAAGESRGVLYGLLALAVGTGVLSNGATLILLAMAVVVSVAMGTVSSANLLAWHSAVLPEDDRRLVVPRLMAVSLAVGSVLLFPVAILLDMLGDRFGLVVYAIPFALAGLAGLGEVAVIRRLPLPGKVIVPPQALSADAPESPEERQFLRASTLNALGMGITPYVAIYAMAILGLSAGFAMTLGAVSMLTMVIAAAIAGGRLGRGSSAGMLRQSFGLRAAAVAIPIAALPGSPFAPLLLYAAVILAGAGFASGQLAANERLFRLIRGPAVIRQHGRFLARTSAATAAGQLASSAVLALGAPLGYPVFALLYGCSSALRVLAHRAADPDRPARMAGPTLEGPRRAAWRRSFPVAAGRRLSSYSRRRHDWPTT